mgnify:CR=1 FL=1
MGHYFLDIQNSFFLNSFIEEIRLFIISLFFNKTNKCFKRPNFKTFSHTVCALRF